MSNVPIVATRNSKGLYGHSHIRHVSPAPLVVGKGPNRVQDAHLKAIDVADPVVHVHPRAVLEPVIQTRTRGLRQGNQKGSLLFFLANLAVNLVHLIQVIVRVGIVEPVPKEGRKDDLDGRKSHLFVRFQEAGVPQYNPRRINVQDPSINIGKARPESLLKLVGDLFSFFRKVQAVVALAPGFPRARIAKAIADAVSLHGLFGQIVVEVFAALEIGKYEQLSDCVYVKVTF